MIAIDIKHNSKNISRDFVINVINLYSFFFDNWKFRQNCTLYHRGLIVRNFKIRVVYAEIFQPVAQVDKGFFRFDFLQSDNIARQILYHSSYIGVFNICNILCPAIAGIRNILGVLCSIPGKIKKIFQVITYDLECFGIYRRYAAEQNNQN